MSASNPVPCNLCGHDADYHNYPDTCRACPEGRCQVRRYSAPEQFEAAYAARSGVTVEFLHQHGRWAEPCDCGTETCEGWAMGHQWEDALFENELRGH